MCRIPFLRTVVIAATLAAGAMALRPLAFADEASCKEVEGVFTSVAVGGPSPVGINTHGLLRGDLNATYDFVMLTLFPDPNNPGMLLYTGISVIETEDGEKMFGEDTGFMRPRPDGMARFVTTVNIVGGTGKYQSGQLVASGVLNLITGDAAGTYEGEICKSKKN